MPIDALELLENDHVKIKAAFDAFKRAEEADDEAGQRAAVERIIELMTVHTYLENEFVYPRVRELLPEVEDDVLESYEEHHVADVLILELSLMSPGDERYAAKTTVLIENVEHHIGEEEDEWFPKVRAGLSSEQLLELGAEVEAAREGAPRKPTELKALKKAFDAMVK